MQCCTEAPSYIAHHTQERAKLTCCCSAFLRTCGFPSSYTVSCLVAGCQQAPPSRPAAGPGPKLGCGCGARGAGHAGGGSGRRSARKQAAQPLVGLPPPERALPASPDVAGDKPPSRPVMSTGHVTGRTTVPHCAEPRVGSVSLMCLCLKRCGASGLWAWMPVLRQGRPWGRHWLRNGRARCLGGQLKPLKAGASGRGAGCESKECSAGDWQPSLP